MENYEDFKETIHETITDIVFEMMDDETEIDIDKAYETIQSLIDKFCNETGKTPLDLFGEKELRVLRTTGRLNLN